MTLNQTQSVLSIKSSELTQTKYHPNPSSHCNKKSLQSKQSNHTTLKSNLTIQRKSSNYQLLNIKYQPSFKLKLTKNFKINSLQWWVLTNNKNSNSKNKSNKSKKQKSNKKQKLTNSLTDFYKLLNLMKKLNLITMK